MERLRPYLLLTRVSLAPSAVVDALVGLAIGTAGAGPGWLVALLACAGSLCAFLGGMAWNDFADRHEDSKTRPERPLPSGALTPAAAFRTGLGLFAVGLLCAFAIDLRAGVLLALVIAAAATYDLAPRGAWSGPCLLGGCRAGNLSFGVVAGLSATQTPGELAHFLPAIGYGSYVLLLSRLSAFEDGARAIGAKGLGPRTYASLAGWVLAFLPVSALALRPQPMDLGIVCACALSVLSALLLLQHVRRVQEWTPPKVGQTMGMGLRRLMIATGSLACMTWHGDLFAYFAAFAALAGMWISLRLREAFPPS